MYTGQLLKILGTTKKEVTFIGLPGWGKKKTIPKQTQKTKTKNKHPNQEIPFPKDPKKPHQKKTKTPETQQQKNKTKNT